MTMHFRMTAPIAGLALLLGTCAGAVELSPSGEGDALVVPIWATTNGHLSVLTVVDSQQRRAYDEYPTQAVKLLLRDAQGQLLFGANLYFHNGEDTWTASVVALPDGRSRIASTDETCVLVGEAGGVERWSGSAELDADHGFIELIVMATLPGISAAGDPSCEGLAERWNSGAWSENPASSLDAENDKASLRGTLNLVNVPKGTSYTIPATALREFSDIPQHTAPSESLPDLASAHDSGTPEGATRSRVCDAAGCVEDSWAAPRDAVAAALMASNLRGEFTNSPALGGRTDLVFTYPLRHRFGEADHPHLSEARSMLQTFNRGGRIVGGIEPICPGPVPEGCNPAWDVTHPSSVALLSFPDGAGPASGRPSAVLGIEAQPVLGAGAPAEGSFRSHFGAVLVGNSGTPHVGIPAIGVALQQFENGNLTGEDGVQQRANYGVATPMARRLAW
jgi:hypothetical protein